MNKIKNLILVMLISIICAAMIGFVACSAGEAGEKGETGNTGASGAQGIQGETGEAGDDGADGATAYEIYLQYYPDYTGDEAQFYEDLANGKLATITLSHTVTYMSNGNTVATQTVNFGDKATAPDDPEYSGHTFDGWFLGDEKWSFIGYIVTEDITLTAKWSYYNAGIEYTTNADDTEYIVTAYSGTDTNIEIAERLDGDTIPVTGIADGVFKDNTSITSISIPATVTSIGADAFSGCTSVTEVKYGGTAQQWAQFTFSSAASNPLHSGAQLYTTEDSSGYTLLTTLSVSENPSSYLYYGCTSLTSLTIEDTVSKIGTQAFYGTTSLDVINYNTDLITGLSSTSKPFDGAGSDKLSLIVDDSVTALPGYLMYNNTNLASVTIGSGVTSIGYYPFRYTTSLKTVYFNTNNLGDISSSVAAPFDGAGSDEGVSVIVAEGVTRIANSTFRSMANLTSVSLPSNLTEIGEYAFYRCISLTSVTIPAKVATIGNNAFYTCSAIETVNYGGTASQWAAIAFGNSSANPISYSKALNLLNSSTNEYELATEITIEGITATSQYAFYLNQALKKVTIGSGVETIGTSTFSSCYSLATVILGDDVTTIGTNAFYNCKVLVEVYNLSTLTLTIGSTDNGYVANYALNIYTDASAAGGTYHMEGDYTFYNDGTDYYLVSYSGSETILTLPTLTINNTATNYKIKQYAFSSNTSITSVVIPSGVTAIGSRAFSACTSLTSITLPATLTSIDTFAFYNCKALTSITIPASVTEISDNAFNTCSGLTAVYYDGTASQWASISFGNAYANPLSYKTPLYLSDGNNGYELATAITLDNDVNAYAFYNCTSILSVTLTSNVTSIDTQAFNSCYQITEVYDYSNLSITAGITTGGYVAFYAAVVYTSSASTGAFMTQGDYLFYRSASNDYYLVRYNGSETELTLPTLTIEGSATTYIVKRSAFRANTSLTSVVIPDNTVTIISTYAFASCSGLTSVTIGKGVTFISNYAFLSCSKLEKAVIAQGTLGSYAFSGCSKLTTLVLGTATTSVTSINTYAFNNCSAITTVYFYGDSTAYASITVGESGNDNFTDATVYYYSATQPTESGNYWYYDASDNIAVWPAA